MNVRHISDITDIYNPTYVHTQQHEVYHLKKVGVA